jgi:flagellar motor switch protein FliG
MSKVDQAAVLLMTLGESEAAAVLRSMGPKEVQAIGTAMAQLADVKPEQVEEVVGNFMNDASGQTGLGVDSDEYIRSVMVKALGEDKANTMVDRIQMGGNTNGLVTLKWMEPRTVADIIRNEHPQIQAIVISYLEPDQSAQILAYLGDKVRSDIVMRVATLDTVHPAALQELNEILEKQFSSHARSQALTMGGAQNAADIMNSLDKKYGEQLMETLQEMDEDLSLKIQDLMFVFENLLNVDDRGIQALLREIASETLIVALKGASDELAQKIFGNMSKRAAELLQDDLDAKGPVRLAEVEEAQREILNAARKLAEDGEISLGSGDDMV